MKMSISKVLDRLALRANQYSRSLGTTKCEAAFTRLKRAAKDYGNALRERAAQGKE